MRNRVEIGKTLMWGLAASVLSFSQARTASEEEEVLGFERELCKAYRDGDITGITRSVTENYTLTDSHANVTGRAEDMEEAQKGDPNYEIFENLEMKARVDGDCGGYRPDASQRNFGRKGFREGGAVHRYSRERERAVAAFRRPCLGQA